MVVPTIQLLAKKANESQEKVANDAMEDSDVKVEVKPVEIKYGAWSSGLVVAVAGAFLFPFLGVPAAIVAIFAYVDHKFGDLEGYLRKRRIARGLGIAALILGIVLVGIMVGCKLRRHFFGRERFDRMFNPGPRFNPGTHVNPGPYCHRPTSDCYGHDIAHIQGIGVVECQQECDRNFQCLSIQAHDGQCYLKNYLCAAGELSAISIGQDYVKVRGNVNCATLDKELQQIRGVDYCQRTGVQCETLGMGDKTYCHRPNSDCVGHDMSHIYSNLQQCLDQCTADPQCLSVQQRDRDCWLKNKVCDRMDLTVAEGKHDYVKSRTCSGQ